MTEADYEAVMRERFGDLWRRPEASAMPPSRRRSSTSDRLDIQAERRTPGLHATQHGEIRAWLRRSHPEWLPDLYLLDAGQVAHVVVTTDEIGQGRTACGRVGHLTRATDEIVPCRTCTA